jgi:AraC-like DNA-binding protein
MEYSIMNSEIGRFYNNRYTQNCSNKTFSITQDEIDTDVFKVSVKEWKTQDMKAHLIQAKAEHDVHIKGGIRGEYAVLHFVCEGETIIDKNKDLPSVISRNTNNSFCSTTEDIGHSFKKDSKNVYFKVLLPYSYINAKAEQYPNVFGALQMMITNRCPVLRKNNLATTLEMRTVMEQIKNASDMGTLASFYFETKIHELLTLQLQQINKIDCSECKYHKFYQEQLNEARNLIETCYQTPPTIAQLAKEVGMSETVLKTNFKNCFGTTIYGYLFEYRMSIAQKLLSNSTLTIAEIGDQTGYEHPSHFTTAFKRKFGVSPVEYKRKRA